jgi:serine/threonine-protein kinase
MLDVGTVVGDYTVEGVLGRGGMATVYSARHSEHGRRVALKVLAGDRFGDPEFVGRFQREGRLQASLEHPHVVTVFDAGESEHGLFLAMRLVSGSTLATLMRERALDARHALILLRQVADALDAAHARGLVHRDVKPQNVLVGESDDAYLGDFGLTRLGGTNGVTVTGRLVGTISYLAPEVIRGGEAVPASDRYAFAAMAFECLTGTVVYPRGSEAAVLFAHTSEPPPRASRRRPELPQGLDGVFERALAKDPDKRPGSAAALVDEISGTLERAGLAALGPPPPPGAAALEEETVEPVPPAPEPRLRRRPVAWLVGGALAGAAVGAALAALIGDGEGRQAAAAPPKLPGAQVLGSDLAEPGRTLDCRGRSPRADSPGCTIVQTALPGRALVVPEDGVIRRWSVRSARGELALAVVRPRGDDTFQVARSRNEFVGNGGVHLFETNLAVERGDLVALVVFPGSAAGARPGVEGATTRRWIPLLPYGDEPVDRGFANELLLRVDYVPGGQQRLPDQVTGAAAAELEPGRVVRRKRLRFTNGRPLEIALVSLGDRFALDEFLEGRRTARIDVPADFRPGEGRIVTFRAGASPFGPEAAEIQIEYTRKDSARILEHYYGVSPREFEFVD